MNSNANANASAELAQGVAVEGIADYCEYSKERSAGNF
jgi:hypothetical protein